MGDCPKTGRESSGGFEMDLQSDADGVAHLLDGCEDCVSPWRLEEGGCYFSGGSGCHCLLTVGGGRLCIWSIHDPIYAMLLTSFHKPWLSQPSSSGRQASMYCIISEAHLDMDCGTYRRMR